MYKVHTVSVIPPLKKMSSNGENDRSKRNPSEMLKKPNFSKILDAECEKVQTEDIRVAMNGYTKFATPFRQLVYMREYTLPADNPLKS